MEATIAYQPVLRRLSAVLSAVRVVDETMPIQEFATFLEIAKRDGEISVMEISTILGMSQSSATRNVQALTDIDSKKKPGVFLVETRTDRMDMRKKYCHLTPKGKRLVEQILNIMHQQGGK